jgi:dUTPase
MSVFDVDGLAFLFKNAGREYTILKIAVTPTRDDLINAYKEKIFNHNTMIQENPYSNAGFDLFVPDEITIQSSNNSNFISMEVKCEMVTSNGSPSAFYLYPRSSISNTPLMMANHVGVIDSGYRGNLIGAFRSLSPESYVIAKNTRLLQITNPSLTPILVKLVNVLDLSSSERGEGGFGSTGI